MNISDLSYLEIVSISNSLLGGLALSTRLSATSTTGLSSAKVQVKAGSKNLLSQGSSPSNIFEINLSATQGDIAGNVEISGLTDADQVLVSAEGEDLNITVSPFDSQTFALSFSSLNLLLAEPLPTS
jgi:hypothetical protein